MLGAALWWHEWMPGLIVVAFVAWVILHRRFQGSGRDAFMRFRARVWPPPTLVLIALILAGPAVYALSHASIEAKVLPIGLNVAALAMLVAGWPWTSERPYEERQKSMTTTEQWTR